MSSPPLLSLCASRGLREIRKGDDLEPRARVPLDELEVVEEVLAVGRMPPADPRDTVAGDDDIVAALARAQHVRVEAARVEVEARHARARRPRQAADAAERLQREASE